MRIQLRIIGQPTSTEEAKDTVRGAPLSGRKIQDETHLLDIVEVLGAYDVRPTARGANDVPVPLDAEDDDIIEFVLEDGVSMWMSVAAYRDRQYRLDPQLKRTRGLDIGPFIPGVPASRGVVSDIATGAVRILRLKRDEIWEQATDPTQWPAWVKEQGITTFEQLGSWLTAKLIIWLIEKKIRPEEGLYRWVKSSTENASSLVPSAGIPSDQPLLLFIHGTASNTLGSFGALHGDDASSEWQTLTQTFKEHIYAFEHRTMSQSPIDNALVLANALPDGARLTIVTHSRGGQVADLLCLKELLFEQIGRFGRKGGTANEADQHDQTQLTELARVLRKKRFQVQRVIRVACPSQGTLLASENLDRFLSVVTSLIGLIPVVGQSPVYQVIKRITLETAKRRWDPSVIPGIESMIPQSPLVALLNAPDVQGAGDLGVIAGDIEGGSWFKRLGVFVTDTVFYDNEDNDLVVNTNSMFQGVSREKPARYIFDQGDDVSHFRYFRNGRTRHLLAQSITGGPWPPEFRPLEEAKVEPVPMLRAIQTRSGAAQPVVFVLPGIMGSELQVDGKNVWMNYWHLFRGGIGKLAFGAPNVKVSGLVGSYYRGLCEYLADSHEVLPFGYDWRQSIQHAASALAEEVQKVVSRTREPIRFLAHSMGGLVVRRFIQDHPDLWDMICRHEGARFIMLGTPNRGSYDMVESLAGLAKTVKQLSLLDVEHSLDEIVALVSGYPGALELLPHDNEWEYFTDLKWATLHPYTESKVQIASRILREAKAALVDLPERIPHADRVRYIAGWAPRTVCGLSLDGERLSFKATTAGDGRVTYQTGFLPDIPVWYVDAEHGDLSDHKPAFPAYRDLLERGVTSQLSTAPLSADRGGDRVFEYDPEPVLYPTTADLEAGLLGRRRRARKVGVSDKLQVSVRHGNLLQTNYPVLMGHYQGDTIAGAEKRVDQMVNGALSQRYHLGRYPGSLGTAAVVLGKANQVQSVYGIQHGAIVLGLGKWGELTPTRLTQAVQQGITEYCVQYSQCCGTTEAPDVSRGLTINSLLIGSNTAANIAVEDSINAIVRGVVLANRALQQQNATLPKIGHLEFVELYLDIAIDAAKSAHRVSTHIQRELHTEIQVSTWLKKGVGGQTRLVPSSARGYWRRWTVTAVQDAVAPHPVTLPSVLQDRLRASFRDEKNLDPELVSVLVELAFREDAPTHRLPHKLRFLALSDRARAEATVQETQSELIGQLIQRSIGSTSYRGDVAKTLFKLLIPLDLKDSLLNQDRVVFVLDNVTANYPWEMMIDSGEPLCVRMGMVRQLETTDSEQRVRDTTSTGVYVVGDPLTPPTYPSLPGARQEAGLVASLLKSRYTVNYSSERLGPIEVLNQLFAQPYRIIHIAGHGYYSEAATGTEGAKAGVVLDNDLFITAAEIAQLDPIPELVFLNCCHLGQIDLAAPNKLAASISRELIRKGVRAVVAAGWPVRDDAAQCFAQTFYTALLADHSFGQALREARKETWAKCPESTTWGAYQAYGDPEFRLRPNVERPTGGDEDVTVAAEEVLITLSRLCQENKETESAKLRDSIVELERNCAEEWLKRGDIQEKFGLAYGEHGLFQNAGIHYELAAKSEDCENSSSLRAIEQWINLEARFGGTTGNTAKIEQAIQRGVHLLALGETSERLSIMGSAYKRLAGLQTVPADVNASLVKAAQFYQRAAKKQEQEQCGDPYPILNWLAIEAVLGNVQVPYESWLSKAAVLAKQRFQDRRSVWDLFTVADIAVVRAYQKGTLPDEHDSLVETYQRVFFESAATKRQRDSARGQLEFLITMKRKLTPVRGGERKEAAVLIALETIVHHLARAEEQKDGEAAAAASPSSPAAKPSPKRSRRRKAVSKKPLRHPRRGKKH